MDQIGNIIKPQQHRGGELLAAAIVATANECLQNIFHFGPLEASVKSIRNGALTIDTEHGAIAGLIMRRANDLLAATNQAIQQRYHQPSAVNKIITRRR